MSGVAAPDRIGETGVEPAPAALTPERIDAILADFRRWLENAAAAGSLPSVEPEPPPLDLHAVAAQFTALRHEVNLQTKATRTAIEQTAEALKLAAPPADPDAAVRPLAKVLIDIADALSTAHRQIERARASVEPLLANLETARLPDPPETAAEPSGFLVRLFGSTNPDANLRTWVDAAVAADRECASNSASAVAALRPLVAGLADGYAMSLRRIERALPQFGIEPIPTDGVPFDPELMEVVEVVDGEGRPGGTVVEEVRRGYRWKGTPFRFAQVKVAR